MNKNPDATRKHLADLERLSPTARQFIRELSDPEAETHHHTVEDLRFAASLLDRTHPRWSKDPAESAAFSERMRHTMARKLREAAQRLCQHVRLHGDTCRYCEVVVSDGCFADDYPPIPEDAEPNAAAVH